MSKVRRNVYRPIEMLTLLGVHIQGDPLAFVPNSEEADRARHRLVEDALIVGNDSPQLAMPGSAPLSYQPYKTTPRGVVWLDIFWKRRCLCSPGMFRHTVEVSVTPTDKLLATALSAAQPVEHDTEKLAIAIIQAIQKELSTYCVDDATMVNVDMMQVNSAVAIALGSLYDRMMEDSPLGSKLAVAIDMVGKINTAMSHAVKVKP